jgi:hypothetical protein
MSAVATMAVAGLATAGTATAAADTSTTVSDATFTWGINNTATAGAYFGGCNFLSAGLAGDNGSSKVWTQTAPSPGYSSQAGNVTVLKPDAAGNYAQPTWADKCTGPDGTTAVTTTTSSGTEVQIANGTGTVDPGAGTASISWTGSFTSVFYGGLAYWSATNPTLTVNSDGTGTVTASVSGYAASMSDPTEWDPIPASTVTLANLSHAQVTDSGITVTPDYLGIALTGTSGSAQVQTGQYWGSFPQDFVDFQDQTGESSYWYSSGLNDQDKVADPITVAYTTTPATPTYDPRLTVTPSSNLHDGDTITVDGTGYDTTTQSPYTHGQAGAYVELGWITPDAWQPSKGAPASSRTNVEAIWVHDNPGSDAEAQLNADGSFEVSLSIDAAALQAKEFQGGTLAVFTVAAGGVTSAGSEAYASITLAQTTPPAGENSETISATVPEQSPAGSFTLTVPENATVTMSQASEETSYLESTGQLQPITVTDSRTGGPAWSVSGQVSDFNDGALAGKYLGWTPQVQDPGAGAQAGDAVDSGLTSGDGLADASVLASADDGHATGSATLGAGLDLRVPLDTPAGTYTATLTLTTLS